MTTNHETRSVSVNRIEIVDAGGRVRLVLGDIGNPERPGEVFGVALLDDDGHQRAWLALDHHGPVLGLDRNGNAVLELGVDDGVGEVVRSGPYFHLGDADGRPVVGWQVDDDGVVISRAGPGS
ncbi:MAG TPA: hypothetical protein VM938_14745 [Acidimicrobiales bacterium]|nr:hypothetical protein [Acidimicrobiales bacterium]